MEIAFRCLFVMNELFENELFENELFVDETFNLTLIMLHAHC